MEILVLNAWPEHTKALEEKLKSLKKPVETTHKTYQVDGYKVYGNLTVTDTRVTFDVTRTGK